MATGNTVFFANQPLFNSLLARYISANASAFSGSIEMKLLKLEFVFGLDGPPTAELAPQAGGGNLALHFDQVSLHVHDYVDGKRGALKNSIPVKVTVTGTLGLNGQNLGLTGLKASGSGRLDERAAKIMNDIMIPEFQKQVANIPLPDFKGVVGLPVSLTALEVRNNQVQVFAQIGNAGGTPTFPSANPSFPAITAAISSGVINQLASSKFPGANESVKDGHSGWAGAWEASANATARNPQVHITNSRGYGTIDVSAGASAGVNPGHLGWVRPGVNVGITTPPLDLRLVQTGGGKKMTVKVYMNGNLGMDFGLPPALKPFADAILGAFRPLVTLITNAINSGLDQINIEAFTLPNKLPGTDLSANLTFQDVRFQGNSVVAVINVG